MDNNQLQHHGIKGMRWGVRRTKAQLRRARGPDTPRRVTKEQYEAEKKKAINSGDVNKVKAWQSRLTNAELREAKERCKLNKELTQIEEGDRKTGLDRVEGIMDNVGRVTNVVNTGLNAYSVIAKINNTFSSKQLPIIDGTNFSKKKTEEAKKLQDEAERKQKDAEKEAKQLRDEAERKAKEVKVANDEAAIYKLIKEGNIDDFKKKIDQYDPTAVKNVSQALNNLYNIDQKDPNKTKT